MSKIIDAIPAPPVYYHASETSYWREDEKGSWIKINETSAKSFIVDRGYSRTASATGSNSEVERCLMKVQSNHNVAYVGPLAGYAAGVREMAGNLVLVTSGPKWIEAKAGDWPTLGQVFSSMFVDGELDQRPYFYGWLKSARDSLKHSRWKASQLLAMAGPVGSGKSPPSAALEQRDWNLSSQVARFENRGHGTELGAGELQLGADNARGCRRGRS